ncbi:MAG TPA: hypothetical protein VFY21_13530, partial [Xanthobacteraceae bacterium]|nr:hypothetical protein [Xanthobacteraceae bacterium]
MNAPIKLAQASTQGAGDIHVVKLEKPASGQAITVKTGFDGKVKLDFSAIADERITIVRVGETAVIFFHDNKSTITLDPFFGSGNLPLANLEFDFGGNRIYTPEQIAAILPFSVYQGILPAAGEGGGDPQNAGADFDPAVFEELPPIALNELLPPEELPGIDTLADLSPGLIDLIPVQSGAVIGGFIEEEELLRSLPPSSPTHLSDGNEDDGIPNDTGDDPDTDFADPVTNSFTGNAGNNQSLQALVLGGDQPITFSFLDVTGDNVTSTAGVNVLSQGDSVIYHRVSPTLVIGYVDEDGSGTFNGGVNDDPLDPIDPNFANGGDDRIVFTLELPNGGNGDWTVTIYDQIDHATLDGLPGDDQENLLSFNFTPTLLATDGNGSQLTFTGNAFAPTVIDDVPVLTEDTDFRSVNEDDIKTIGDGEPGGSRGTSPNDGPFDGSFTGSPFDNTKGPATIFGSLTDVVKVGADEHEATEGNDSGLVFEFITDEGSLDGLNGLGLLSKGDAVVFGFEGGNLVARADGRLVMELILQPDGGYSFRLHDQLDHDAPYDSAGDFPFLPGDTLFPPADQNHDLQDGLDGEDVVFINFGSVIKASDFDGDSVVLDNKLLIKVTDDIPEIRDCEPICLTVNEDDISTRGPNIPGHSLGTSPNDGNWDGSFTGSPFGNGKGPATVFGSLGGLFGIVEPGADENLTFSFVTNGHPQLEQAIEQIAALAGLKSKGDELRYDIQGNILYAFAPGGGGQGYQEGQGDRLVFQFTLQSDGDFKFELFDQLDHDAPNDDWLPFGLADGDGLFPGSDQNTDLQDDIPFFDV